MDKLMKRVFTFKILAGIVGVYFSLLGFFTFPLFITEESIQVVQFGTWAAKTAKDWDFMASGCEKMRDIAADLDYINQFGGWLNPFSYRAYSHFASSTKYYAAACDKQVVAKQQQISAKISAKQKSE